MRFLSLLSFCAITYALNAATYTVSNRNDSGNGSLRQALLNAVPGDTINIQAGPIIIGTSEETALPVLTGVTINGYGNTISGQNTYPIFFAFSGTNEINDLTLIDGSGVGGDGGSGASGGGGAMGAGGGLFIAPGATVNLSNVQFLNCTVAGGNGGAAVIIVSEYCNGGGGGGGGYNSNGGNAGYAPNPGSQGSGGGGGGVFNCDGGQGIFSGGGGGGTHKSKGGDGNGLTPAYGNGSGGGGGGGVYCSPGGDAGFYSSGGGGGYNNAPGGGVPSGDTTNQSFGGGGGGGKESAGGSPTDTITGGAGGSNGGGNGGDGVASSGNAAPGMTGANPYGGGGGGGSSNKGNGGDGGAALNIGGGGGGGCAGFIDHNTPVISGVGGSSAFMGGGGGGGTSYHNPGATGGNANFGGGGGGGQDGGYYAYGGNGGSSTLFGGGGGAGLGNNLGGISYGGHGGIGGGGGGAASQNSTPGSGGFGGGDGGVCVNDPMCQIKGAAGGGGSAYGGAVFIANGGTLTVNDGGVSGNSAGPGGTGYTVGDAAGNGFYLMADLGDGPTNLVFNVSDNNTVTIPDSIAGNGTIEKTGSGTLILAAANTPFTGSTLITDGTVVLTGELDSYVEVDAPGVLSGTGVMSGNLQNNGVVSPGNETGVLTVLCSYTQTGELLINTLNATPTNWGQLSVNGQATLGGTLVVNLLPGNTIQNGDEIVVLTSMLPLSGQFSNFVFNTTCGAITASLIYTADQVLVRFGIDYIPAPPVNLRGKQLKNKFLTQTEYVNQISWDPSPSLGVVKYEIYRNGVKIAVVAASRQLVYEDHNQPRGVPRNYEVAAVNCLNNASELVSVIVPSRQ